MGEQQHQPEAEQVHDEDMRELTLDEMEEVTGAFSYTENAVH